MLKGSNKFACQDVWLPAVAVLVLVLTVISFCQESIAARIAAKKVSNKLAAVSGPAVQGVYFFSYPPMLCPIRIGITTRAPSARIACWSPGAVFVDNKPIFNLQPKMVYLLTPGRITEYGTNVSVALPSDRRAQIASRDERGEYKIWTNDHWYRGTLELITMGSRITVINLLDLEDYLRGVVPSEMPSSWMPEALKAQAVAARSYAAAHIHNRNLGNSSKWFGSEGFDLVPDVRDQAYKGLNAEAPSTNLAVDYTRGLVLRDANKVKPGFYRATVGDNQEENLNLRRKSVPNALLENLTGVKQIAGVTVKQWDPYTQNATALTIMGAKKSRDVDGRELCRRLNFDTAGILDVAKDGSSWLFTYRGPGNGVRGLSQHGANTFAKNGWNFEQILRQYYQDRDGNLYLVRLPEYEMRMMRPVKRPRVQKDDDEAE
jgi:stage II sporulation protein D